MRNLLAACFSLAWLAGLGKVQATGEKDKSPGWINDPLFTGFNGATFEFFGIPGHNYSVYADASLTLNMQMISAGPENFLHKDQEGTFAGAVAIILPSRVVIEAQVNESGNMTVKVNALEVDIESPYSTETGQISYEPYVPEVGQQLTVISAPFNMSILAVKQYTDTVSGYNRGHLDLQVAAMSSPVGGAQGILGQTLALAPGDEVSKNQTQFELPSLTSNAYFDFQDLQKAQSSIALPESAAVLLAGMTTKSPASASEPSRTV